MEIVAHRAQAGDGRETDPRTRLRDVLSGRAGRVELDAWALDGRLVVAHDARDAARPGVLPFDTALALIGSTTCRLLADIKDPAAARLLGELLAARDFAGRTIVCGELEPVELAGRISGATRAWTLPTGRPSFRRRSPPGRLPAASAGLLGFAGRSAKRRVERAALVALEAGRSDAVCVEHRFVTAGLVRGVHLAGGRVLAWTVDDPADARRMAGLGVDELITNDPDGLAGGSAQWSDG